MVEIIPKPAKKLPKWQNIVFYVSLTLVVTAVLAYVFLIYFENKALNAQQGLEDKIADVGTAAEKALEKEVFAEKKKISDFSTLLILHQKPSQLFTFLEGVTHPKVWFSEVALDMSNSQVMLFGQAPNFSTLGQQLLVLRSEKSIKEINLSELSLGDEGNAEFTIRLSLAPEIFK